MAAFFVKFVSLNIENSLAEIITEAVQTAQIETIPDVPAETEAAAANTAAEEMTVNMYVLRRKNTAPSMELRMK